MRLRAVLAHLDFARLLRRRFRGRIAPAEIARRRDRPVACAIDSATASGSTSPDTASARLPLRSQRAWCAEQVFARERRDVSVVPRIGSRYGCAAPVRLREELEDARTEAILAPRERSERVLALALDLVGREGRLEQDFGEQVEGRLESAPRALRGRGRNCCAPRTDRSPPRSIRSRGRDSAAPRERVPRIHIEADEVGEPGAALVLDQLAAEERRAQRDHRDFAARLDVQRRAVRKLVADDLGMPVDSSPRARLRRTLRRPSRRRSAAAVPTPRQRVRDRARAPARRPCRRVRRVRSRAAAPRS